MLGDKLGCILRNSENEYIQGYDLLILFLAKEVEKVCVGSKELRKEAGQKEDVICAFERKSAPCHHVRLQKLGDSQRP